MRKRIFIIAIFGIITLCAPGVAENIPKPRGWVNDYANVISDEYSRKLQDLLQELKEKTSAEVAVVTVDSITPYDEKEYARLLFDSWRPGKAGKDNGAILLLAIRERRWRIETGYGLEGVLPDGVCGEIGRNYMVPYFKEARYGEGLYHGATAIAKKIADDHSVNLNNLADVKFNNIGNKVSIFVYIFVPVFFFLWNLPWPFFVGLSFTIFFGFVLFQISTVLGGLVIASYIASLIFRLVYWNSLSPSLRKNFFGPQTYGGTYTGGYGGGFGGGGFGGFGGGSGGGGGAGGGF